MGGRGAALSPPGSRRCRHLGPQVSAPARASNSIPQLVVGWALDGLRTLKPTWAAPFEQMVALGKHGGKRTKGQGVGHTLKRGSGNSEYGLSRLQRDRPDLLVRVKAGELTLPAATLQARREAGKPDPAIRVRLDPNAHEKAAQALLKHGGDRRSAESKAKDQPSVRRLKYGETSEYLRARLARDGHAELLARVDAKEISVRAAAIEARIVKLPTGLDRLRTAWKKASARQR